MEGYLTGDVSLVLKTSGARRARGSIPPTFRQFRNIMNIYTKSLAVIDSCKTRTQLMTAFKYISLAHRNHYIDYSGYFLLYQRLRENLNGK